MMVKNTEVIKSSPIPFTREWGQIIFIASGTNRSNKVSNFVQEIPIGNIEQTEDPSNKVINFVKGIYPYLCES